VAAPGLGKGQPVVTDPAAEAQILRGQALDRHYGLGRFAVDPATEAQILRGQALSRHYQRNSGGVDPATEAQILRGQALGRHYQVDAIQGPIVSPDAVDRAVAAKELQGSIESQPSAGRGLVFDDHRTGAVQQSAGRTLVFDNHRLEELRPPEQISVSSSGRDIEWPQLGIGFGLGVALLLGLLLTVRFTRTRPLAH
jgi:hypothetical protein